MSHLGEIWFASTWALEAGVNYRLREYTGPVSPPAAFKRATTFSLLDFDQSGRNFAFLVVVLPSSHAQCRYCADSSKSPVPFQLLQKLRELDWSTK